MGRPVVDKTGLRYGRLTVTSMVPRIMHAPVVFVCLCDCGKTVAVDTKYLGNGKNSCGCLRTDVRRARPLKPLRDRFERMIERVGRCWRWTGAIDPETGYGRIGLGKQSDGIGNAHRVAYELAKGPVPAGLLVCHTCDHRWCVNPEHLYVGTHSDNINDAWARTRRRSG